MLPVNKRQTSSFNLFFSVTCSKSLVSWGAAQKRRGKKKVRSKERESFGPSTSVSLVVSCNATQLTEPLEQDYQPAFTGYNVYVHYNWSWLHYIQQCFFYKWTDQYSSGLGILRGMAFSSSNRRWSNIRSSVLLRDKKLWITTKMGESNAVTIAHCQIIPTQSGWLLTSNHLMINERHQELVSLWKLFWLSIFVKFLKIAQPTDRLSQSTRNLSSCKVTIKQLIHSTGGCSVFENCFNFAFLWSISNKKNCLIDWSLCGLCQNK